MLMTIFCALFSAALTAVTAIFGGIRGWFLLFVVPLFIGYFLLAIVLVLSVAFLLSITENVTKTRTKPIKFFLFLFNFVDSFICVWSGARLIVTGEEKLDKTKKYLFIFNHRSNFDPMLLAKRFRKFDILMISKPDNFKIPVVGRSIHKAGYMPIDRENDREAMKTIIQSANYLKSGDYSIGVCPEGTRNKKDLDLLPFRHGAFKIATKANAPIAVIAINGCEKIHKNFPFRRTVVYIDVVDVISPDDYAGKTTTDISDEAATKIRQAIKTRN